MSDKTELASTQEALMAVNAAYDLPLRRRQLPDGSVPENTEQALTCWFNLAEDRGIRLATIWPVFDEMRKALGWFIAYCDGGSTRVMPERLSRAALERANAVKVSR